MKYEVIKAFFVAPIAPFLAYLVVSLIPRFSLLLFVVLFGLPVVYLAALIGGLPLYLVIKKRPYLHQWYIVVFFACLLGGLTMFLFMMFAISGPVELSKEAYLMGLWGMAHGAASGIIFWRIAKPTLNLFNRKAA